MGPFFADLVKGKRWVGKKNSSLVPRLLLSRAISSSACPVIPAVLKREKFLHQHSLLPPPPCVPPSRLRSVLSYLHHLLNFPFHSFSSIPPRKEGEEGTSQTWRRGGGRGDEDVGVLLLAKALLMLYGYGDSFSGRGEHIRQCPGDGGESL